MKNDYLGGQKPAAIAAKIGVKVATVRQMLWRQGLTDERESIKEAAARTAGEVLEDARKRHAEKLTGILDKQIKGIEMDTEKLSEGQGGWDQVHGAADFSALMRGKDLLQRRTLRHFGLDAEREAPARGFDLGIILGFGMQPPMPVNVTPTNAAPPENPKVDESN